MRLHDLAHVAGDAVTAPVAVPDRQVIHRGAAVAGAQCPGS